MSRLTSLLFLLFSHLAIAQEATVQSLALVEDDTSPRYLAQVQAHTKSEIETLLDRADGVVNKVLEISTRKAMMLTCNVTEYMERLEVDEF